jgi:hypothetical protein
MKKKWRATEWMFVLMLTVGAFPAAADPQVGSVTVHRATGKIFADGNLDEPDWARVPLAGTFRVYPTDVAETPEAGDTTEIRMLWDDHNLYVAFKANDRDILATRTTVSRFSSRRSPTIRRSTPTSRSTPWAPTSRRFIRPNPASFCASFPESGTRTTPTSQMSTGSSPACRSAGYTRGR